VVAIAAAMGCVIAPESLLNVHEDWNQSGRPTGAQEELEGVLALPVVRGGAPLREKLDGVI
jgi:hypothetical protein